MSNESEIETHPKQDSPSDVQSDTESDTATFESEDEFGRSESFQVLLRQPLTIFQVLEICRALEDHRYLKLDLTMFSLELQRKVTKLLVDEIVWSKGLFSEQLYRKLLFKTTRPSSFMSVLEEHLQVQRG